VDIRGVPRRQVECRDAIPEHVVPSIESEAGALKPFEPVLEWLLVHVRGAALVQRRGGEHQLLSAGNQVDQPLRHPRRQMFRRLEADNEVSTTHV